MGGAASNYQHIFYNTINDEQNINILNHFKSIYSDENVNEIFVHSSLDKKSYYIYSKIYFIYFINKLEVIKFINEYIDRPFVFTNSFKDGYEINFVYGNNL